MSADLLLALAVPSGVAAIASDRGRRQPGFYLFKPLTTALLLAAAALLPGAQGPAYRESVLVALALCWLGDVALMLTGTTAFLAGLSAFLLGHLAFCAALLQGLPIRELPWWLLLPPLLGAVVGLRVRRLRIPVTAYAVTLLAMLTLALWRAWSMNMTATWLAAAGALAFVISDSLLARRRFVADFPHAQAWILGSYWLGIGLLSASV